MVEMRNVSTNWLWRRFTFILIVIVLLAAATLISIGITTTSPKNAKVSDFAFLRIAKSVEGREFIGTYIVRGNASPFIFVGKIVLASDPAALSKHPPVNVAGYSGAGEYFAYVFTHSDGSVVQWVQKGGIVSWCLKFSWVDKGRLECTGPGPFYPSNGYAYQLLPFVQTTLLSQVEDFLSGQPKRLPPVVVERSNEFGTLHCLVQTSGVPHLKTCVNRAGFIVSSNYRRGKYWYSTTLESLGRRPAASEFVTLQAPSKNVPLPPA